MELDSLELKVSAEAQSAEKALDSLIGKLQSFSKALGGINTTSISKNLENLAKVGGLKTVTKEVEDLGKTVDNVGKKKTKTEVKVDVKQGLEAIAELQKKYANVGRGAQFSGTTTQLEKQYSKLSADLDKLLLKEDEFLNRGKANIKSTSFDGLEYKIQETINKLDILKVKITEAQQASQARFRIENTSNSAIMIPPEDITRQAESTGKKYSETLGQNIKIPDSAIYRVEDSIKSLNDTLAKVRTENSGTTNKAVENALQGYDKRIQEAKAKLTSIEASGKGMGTSEWDKASMALTKLEDEAKRYKAALNQKALGLDTDIKSTDNLETKIKKLNLALDQMRARGIGFGDTNFDKMYQQLNEAEKELAEYKAKLTESETSTRSFGSTLKSAATGFSSFIGKIKNAGAATLNFAKNVRNMKSPLTIAFSKIGKLGSAVAKLYFKYMMLSRVAGALGKVLGVSSDYIEEYNYFQKAIDKIAQENKGNYKKYGYDDAKSYADSFEDRLTTLTGKMTGYKPGKDGNLIDTGAASLGLDITQVTNFEAQIAQMTNSVGMMGEASIATSKAMTMLAGDMSSLTNMPLDTVMKNFSSGLSGAAMAVKKYGMDISVAALQETALGLGVKKSVSDMTQAEKEYLRVITMLQQSKVAWGDLADTINQPANQFRMLKSNIKQCGLMLSRLFMPVIQAVLPWLNAMAMAVKDLMKHIGDLFGLKFDSIGGSSSSSDAAGDYDDVSDSADKAADSVNNAADAQKKFNKQLQGFDKLNNLTTNESSKDKDKNKNNTAGDTSGVLSDALINAVEDYEKRWNKAFKGMTSKADELKEKIEKLFKTAWDTGDGTEIGEALATTLNKGIEWVNNNQDEWSSGLNKITGIMGTTLNGFVNAFDWPGLGSAVGGSIKTALEAEKNFFETVNWVNLGSSLSTSLNSAVESGVLQTYFETMASKLKAAIEAAFGAIKTFKFNKLGKALGQGINDFFDTMNETNDDTKLTGWEELGQSLTDGISGIADSLATAIKTVKWEKIGQAIKELISSIDMDKIGWSVGNLVSSMINAFYTLVANKKSWKKIGTKIAEGINGVLKAMNKVDKKTGLNGWQALGKSISKSISGIATTITTALKKVKWNKVGQAIADFIKSINFLQITWDFTKMAAAAFNAIVDAVSSFAEKAPLETAIIGLFAGLKLTGLDTKISRVIQIALAGKNLSLGKIALGLGLGAATFRLADSDSVVKKTIMAPLTAFAAAKTFGLSIKVSLGIAGVTLAAGAGLELGEKIGEAIANATQPEEMKKYRKNFTWSDLFTYSPSEWIEGIKLWWNDTFGSGVDDMWDDIVSGDFKIKIGGFSFPSYNEWTADLDEWWEGVKKYWGDKYVSIKGKIDKKAEKIKKWWGNLKEGTKELLAEAKGKITKKFDEAKEAWGKVKEGTKTLLANAKAKIIGAFDKVVEGWNNIKEGVKNLWAKAKGKIEDTFEQAQKAWSDFKEGTKNLFVEATGEVKEKFKEVAEKWSTFKEGAKTVMATAKGDIKKKFDELTSKWKDLVSKTVTVTGEGSIRGKLEKLGKVWKTVKTKTATLTGTAKQEAKNVFKSMKEKWDTFKDKTATLTATFVDFFTAPLKKAWNALAGAINKGLGIINKIPGVKIPSVPKLAKGGIFENGSWHNIAKYASGGTPNMGQLFYAREAGPELVGTLKGRGTAVMNNDQIVASVSQGVSDAVYNVMTPVLTSLVSSINRMNSSGTPLYVEGVSEGDIVKITQNANADYKKRYGKPLFT